MEMLSEVSFARVVERFWKSYFTFLTLVLSGLALVIPQIASSAIYPVTINEFLISTGKSSPGAITAGPDGNLWFTEHDGNNILRFTPSKFYVMPGAITKFPIPTVGNNPGGITAGPDGDLWFTEGNLLGGESKIGRITPSGVITEFPVPTAYSFLTGITAGPDGNLWFTEANGNKIGRITPSGAITEFPLPTVDSHPYGITAGPDGNLWFTEANGNKIGRLTPSGAIAEFLLPTADSYPYGITAGPDGNLWFTELYGNKIGCITPAGAIIEYPLPSSGIRKPDKITVGPDGNLWFAEYHDDYANYLGQVVPCTATLSPDLKIYVPIVNFNGANFWGTASCEVAADGSVMCRVTTYAANPAQSNCQASTLSADMKHLHIPFGNYNDDSYHADFENVPTTDGQMWFKLTNYGKNIQPQF